MYPDECETITCEYCGKNVVASEDMEYWLCVSEVIAEQESLVAHFCSYCCLKAWAKESEASQLSRMTQQEEGEWILEELLLRHNLLDKVERHEDSNVCPLCGLCWESGDTTIFVKGKPIHSHCIDELKRKDSSAG